MTSPLSRRAWLRTTSLGVGAGLLLPGALPAESTPRWPAFSGDVNEYAREVQRQRRFAGPVRLQSNENPYGMSPRARQAMTDAWDEHNKYGTPSIRILRDAYAKYAGVPAECVMVTQGSREVLCTAALTFGMRGADILTADPTFEALPQYAEHMGLTVHRVPLTEDHVHDVNAMDQRLVASVGLVFVCNPNNPTGTLVPDSTLRDYVVSTAKRTPVLVDEAYHDYVTDPSYRSMTDLVVKGENVIVLRTASKIHGLAGCRIGFAIARPDIIARMQGYTTGVPNALAARAAIAAVADTEWQEFCRTKNAEGREILRAAVEKMGKKQSVSHANFIFVHAGIPTAKVQGALAAKNFTVGRAFPPYLDWVRISIGTPDEMQALVRVLPDALSA